MIGTLVLPFLFNLWFRKFLNAFEIMGGVLHIALFVAFIVILAALGQRSSSDYVFRTLTSDVSGWNNPGASWGLGLLTITFSVTGFDSVIHMSKLLTSKIHQPNLQLAIVNHSGRRRGQES